jgi:hypothetical protein
VGRAFCVHRTPKSTSSSAPLRISRFAVIVTYASSPVPPFQAETLRRPQRPGKPARVTAFLETLQQSTLGDRRKPPASSRCTSRRLRLVRACVKAMCPITNRCSRTKSSGVVTKLWRMSIICGKYRKTRGKIGKQHPPQRHRGTENAILEVSFSLSPPYSSPCQGCLQIRDLTFVTCNYTVYIVIRSFRHRGIEKFFRTGSKAGIQPQHAEKLRLQLFALDNAKSPADMNAPTTDIQI